MVTDSEIESHIIPPEDEKRFRISVYWWHWLIGAALAVLLTLLSPRGKSPEFAYLTEGSISRDKIIAPFDFEILKPHEKLEQERNDAAANVRPVLTAIDTIKEVRKQELLDFAAESQKFLSTFPPSIFEEMDRDKSSLSLKDSVFFTNGSDRLFNQFGFRLSIDSWRFLIRLYDQDQKNKRGEYPLFFEKYLAGILLDVYNQGVINVPRDQLFHSSDTVMIQYASEESVKGLKRLLSPDESLEHISSLLKVLLDEDNLPPGAFSATYEILQPFVTPNIIYNDVETEDRRKAAIDKVPLARGFVKKDELIIDANIRVTPEHLDKLSSLAHKRTELEKEMGGVRALKQIIGQFILVLLVVLSLGVFIALAMTNIWRQWKMMLLVALVLALVHLFQALVPVKYDLPRYMFPAAVGAMLLAILVDRGVALAGVVALALIAGLIRGNDFPIAFSAVMIGGAALFAVRRVQTRGDVMRAALYLIGVYIPLVAAFHFVHFTSGQPLLTDLAIAGANAVLSPTLVLGLVIICESIFGITTDLSLLELVDLNRPLLRELAIKSPGTYHHSIMVGSLAESAAREIGANTLLTRAGAYYHDIGKMENREYFIENQETGSQNIHDRLAPEKSAAVVINHVPRGLELAEKYHLPRQIKAFINEHHGRSKLAFFYAKAVREKGEDVDETIYHYPGPNPRSKETGILMLADTVEAATKSMDNHSPEEIRETVSKLIKMRLSEGDLDECPLTLQEIGTIRETFVRVLIGIYHQRIQYPDQKSENSKAEKIGAEDT